MAADCNNNGMNSPTTPNHNSQLWRRYSCTHVYVYKYELADIEDGDRTQAKLLGDRTQAKLQRLERLHPPPPPFILIPEGDGVGCTAWTAAALLEQQQDTFLSGLQLYFFGRVSFCVYLFAVGFADPITWWP